MSSLPGPIRAILLITCLYWAMPAQSLTIEGNRYLLGQEVEYLQDATGRLTLEQLLASPRQYPFTPLSESRPSGRDAPVWIRLELEFSEAAMLKRYFLVSRVENIDEIRLFRPRVEGGFDETVTGNRYPASTRELPSPRYGFVIEPTDETLTLYLRYIGGMSSHQFPWCLVEAQTYRQNSRLYYLLDVASLSAIAALLLFNICIALTLRKREYTFYCLYIFCVMMTLLTLDGLGFYFLWPDHPQLNDRALHAFNLLSATMRLLTILSFLGMAKFAPRMQGAGNVILALTALVLLPVMAVGVSRLPPLAPAAPWLIANLFGFVVCGYAIYQRIRLAKPLLITMLVPTVAALMQAQLILNSEDISMLELQVAKFGFVVHILLFSLCLSARIKQETESRIDAMHDGLTGLPGTRLLQERFDQAAAFSARHGGQIAVFFIDLDGFKAVNDKLGHAAGDSLLAEVARRLLRQLRKTDTVARIGGDEFVVLLTQVEQPAAVHTAANKLLRAVAEPYLIQGREARISASIGIAMHPGQGESLQELLHVADASMYSAKHAGKNTYRAAEMPLAGEPA